MKPNPAPSPPPSLAKYLCLFPARTTGNKSYNFLTSGPFDSSSGLWERHVSRCRNGHNKSFATWAAPTLFSPGWDAKEPCGTAPGDEQRGFPPPLSRPHEGLEVSRASCIKTSSRQWFKITRTRCSAVGEVQHVSFQHSLFFLFEILV